jgi:hypothetical protein
MSLTTDTPTRDVDEPPRRIASRPEPPMNSYLWRSSDGEEHWVDHGVETDLSERQPGGADLDDEQRRTIAWIEHRQDELVQMMNKESRRIEYMLKHAGRGQRVLSANRQAPFVRTRPHARRVRSTRVVQRAGPSRGDPDEPDLGSLARLRGYLRLVRGGTR